MDQEEGLAVIQTSRLKSFPYPKQHLFNVAFRLAGHQPLHVVLIYHLPNPLLCSFQSSEVPMLYVTIYPSIGRLQHPCRLSRAVGLFQHMAMSWTLCAQQALPPPTCMAWILPSLSLVAVPLTKLQQKLTIRFRNNKFGTSAQLPEETHSPVPPLSSAEELVSHYYTLLSSS